MTTPEPPSNSSSTQSSTPLRHHVDVENPLENVVGDNNTSGKTAGDTEYTLGPVVWLIIWFLLNVSVTILNKSVFKFQGFTYPLTLSFVHMTVSSLCSVVYLHHNPSIPRTQLDRRGYALVCLFSVIFCFNILVGNTSLRFVNVSFSQVVRSIIPGVTVCLSMIILRKRYPHELFYSLIPVIFGVALASYGEVEFAWIGFSLLLTVCFLAALKVVVNNKLLVGQYRHHPVFLLYRLAPLAALQLFIMMLLFGEIQDIASKWETHGNLHTLSLVLTTGFMAFWLNVSNFFVNKTTSPLTLTVAGNVKHVVTILLSIAIFQNPISLNNGIGTTIAVAGAAWYSKVEYTLKQKQKAQVQDRAE